MAELVGARRIVLTGGIGSGKSTVGDFLARWGAYVVDADRLARSVVLPGTKGWAAVRERFGSDVVAADGSLDRPALAELVFGDRGMLDDLEAIVHPLVRAAAAAECDSAAARAARLVVYEVPLLGHGPFEDPPVVVVDTPEELRCDRLVARGLSRDQAMARIRSQPSAADYRAAADRVVHNTGSAEDLASEVSRLWQEITGDEPVVSTDG